jgi:hypothetical protein
METLQIIRPSLTAVTVNLKANSEVSRKLLGEDIAKVYFERPAYIELPINSYITVFGRKYVLNTTPVVKKVARNLYEYDCVFESLIYELGKIAFLDVDATGIHMSSDFYLTGNLMDFLHVLERNLERVYGTDYWAIQNMVGTTDYKTLSFSDTNCLNALYRLCQEFSCEYEYAVFGNERVLYVKNQAGGFTYIPFEYGKGKGLYSLTRNVASADNIVTRLFAFGASKNLGPNYRNFSPRLKLPNNEASYLNDPDAQTNYGIIEKIAIFDDIYPEREGQVTALGASWYQFVDSGMFDLNQYLVDGLTATIHFNTGNLAGYEFEVASYNPTSKTFHINKVIDERGLDIPNPETSAFQFAVGDKYVILNITLPEEYIEAAEEKLYQAAFSYLNKHKNPLLNYALDIDESYVKANNASFGPGDGVYVIDTNLGLQEIMRAIDVRRNIVNEFKYILQLTEVSYKPRRKALPYLKKGRDDRAEMMVFSGDASVLIETEKGQRARIKWTNVKASISEFLTEDFTLFVLNDHEPTESTDDPSPGNANFYLGDDHVYFRINNLWKRHSISTF